jgi:hypothetical protein
LGVLGGGALGGSNLKQEGGEIMLVDVSDFFDVARGDGKALSSVQRALNDLVDELNSCLPGYEVCFVHLDTGDFLEFLSRPIRDDESPF